jgi:hypothetical protein
VSYRVSGQSTEFCSCDAPCPCAFGQAPTGGTCKGIFCFHIEEGELDGLSLSGTTAVLVSTFDGPWTGGNFTAALVLDENASQEQRDALEQIYTGQLGGDAAGLAGLVGDMKGVFTAPIEYSAGNGDISFTAGEMAEGAGTTLKNVDGSAEIQVTNAHYPLPTVTAGKSSKVMVNVPGVEYDLDGSGFWTGPFELSG